MGTGGQAAGNITSQAPNHYPMRNLTYLIHPQFKAIVIWWVWHECRNFRFSNAIEQQIGNPVQALS
jgi:hypothetical protein